MKTTIKNWLAAPIVIAVTLAFTVAAAYAQKENRVYMQKAPANVSVDGKIAEWGDSLASYDIKTKLNYTIANNDTDLYIIAFVADNATKRKIMAGGITISVNPEGKKRKTFSLTYPVPDGTVAFTPHPDSYRGDDDGSDIKKPSLLQTTSIRVVGFKEVESDVITTANTYGFQAALKFDDKRNLIYETAIPLKMLNIKPGKTDDFEINVQINAVERPEKKPGEGETAGGGRGGMGGGGRGGGRRGGGGQSSNGQQGGIGEETDFWIKLALAPAK